MKCKTKLHCNGIGKSARRRTFCGRCGMNVNNPHVQVQVFTW